MGVLNKAKEKSTEKAAAPSAKGECWRYGEAEEGVVNISADISTFIKLEGEKKILEGKIVIPKGKLMAEANNRFFNHLAKTGEFPESPTYLMNEKGERVTFVVQNKTGSTDVTARLIEELNETILDPEHPEETLDVTAYVREEGVFAFNRTSMADPVISAKVEGIIETAFGGVELSQKEVSTLKKAMEALRPKFGDKVDSMLGAILGPVRSGVLDEDTVGSLFTYSRSNRFVPEFLGKIPTLCKRNSGRIRQVFDHLGSMVTRYVKV